MRDTSGIKMIVTDVDGTLVPRGDRISEQLLHAVQSLKEKRIVFTLATGRSWRQTKHLVRALDVTAPVVVQSGALVIDPKSESILESALISQADAEQLWWMDAVGVDWFHLGLNGIYSTIRIDTPEGERLQSYLGEECQLVEKQQLDLEEGTVKLLGVGDRRVIKKLQKRIKRIYPEGRQIIWPGRRRSDGWYMEIFASKAYKARAVRRIANGIGLSMTGVMAFGDGDNDCELIAEAGFGCAIKSAPRHIRRRAKAIVEGPERDGVAKALRRWVLKTEEVGPWKKWYTTFIPTRF